MEAVRTALLVGAWFVCGVNVAVVVGVLVGSYVLVDALMLWLVWLSVRGSPLRLDPAQFRQSLRYGLREYMGSLLATLNVKIDLFVLALFLERAELGLYAVAVGISEVFEFLPGTVSFVLFPRVSRGDDTARKRRVVNKCIVYNLVLMTPVWIGFVIFGRWIVPLVYGRAYAGAYSLAVFLMLGMLILSTVTLANKFFSGIGRPELKSAARAVNLPIKGLLLYWLCRRYGTQGAAVAFVLSNLCLLLGTLRMYAKVNPQAVKP
jgi:O-antigen/teichoic acid export membrane protein